MSGLGEIRTRDFFVANEAIYRADLLAHEKFPDNIVISPSDINLGVTDPAIIRRKEPGGEDIRYREQYQECNDTPEDVQRQWKELYHDRQYHEMKYIDLVTFLPHLMGCAKHLSGTFNDTRYTRTIQSNANSIHHRLTNIP